MPRAGAAPGVFLDMFEDYLSKLTDRHGEERAREVVSARHLFIFPNVLPLR